MKTTEYDVRVGEHRQKVVIDDAGSVTLEGAAMEVDVRRLGGSSYSILVNGKSFVFGLARVEGGYTAVCAGIPATVTLDTERSRLLRSFTVGGTHATGETIITAPMPALVVRTEVEVGQKVTQGQGVLVLEAMKMENEIKAPCSGIVQHIHVSNGRAVEKGEALITLA